MITALKHVQWGRVAASADRLLGIMLVAMSYLAHQGKTRDYH